MRTGSGIDPMITAQRGPGGFSCGPAGGFGGSRRRQDPGRMVYEGMFWTPARTGT